MHCAADQEVFIEVMPLFGKDTVIKTRYEQISCAVGLVRELLATEGRAAVVRRYKELYRRWIGYNDDELAKRLQRESSRTAAREELTEYVVGVTLSYAARLVLTGRTIPIRLDGTGVHMIDE